MSPTRGPGQRSARTLVSTSLTSFVPRSSCDTPMDMCLRTTSGRLCTIPCSRYRRRLCLRPSSGWLPLPPRPPRPPPRPMPGSEASSDSGTTRQLRWIRRGSLSATLQRPACYTPCRIPCTDYTSTKDYVIAFLKQGLLGTVLESYVTSGPD